MALPPVMDAIDELYGLGEFGTAFIDHSPSAMAMLGGVDHIVRYVNPAFCELLCRSETEMIGIPFRQIIAQQNQCLAVLERVLRTGKAESHTEEAQSASPIVFWSYVIWPVVTDKRRIGVMIHVTETARFHETTVALNEALMLGCVRENELSDAAEHVNQKLRDEILERSCMEDALRASEERFRALFNLGPVAIFSCDRQGIIQNYNRRAVELWGRNLRSGKPERTSRPC